MLHGSTRSGLKIASVIAAVTLVVTACGGSEVTGAADVTSAAQPAPAGTDVGVAATGPAKAVPESADAVPGSADAVPATPSDSPRAQIEDASAVTVDSPKERPSSAGTKRSAANKNTAVTSSNESSGQELPRAAIGLAGAAEKLVATAPLFGGKGKCTPATLSEVRVANLSTLSGVLGELFAPVVPALNTFVTAQNACGGLNGHKIKMIFGDDQGDPSTAVALAQRLIEKERILAFVGNIQVLTIHAIIPTIKKSGIPIFGGDLTSRAWFENPLVFPQGSSIQSFAAAYLGAVKDHFKETVIGNLWCIEVPASCGAVNTALHELAPQFGITIASAPQVSITAPTFVQQCLEMKNAGVKAVILSVDAATAVRFARSCQQVGFAPETLIHQIGIGNEQQFFGNAWLGGTYVPMNVFPHMAVDTPAQRHYQASVRTFNPGFDTGGAASTGWTAGALLVAAAANLPAENPTTQNLLDTAYEFKGQKFTQLGGLSAAPLTFVRDGIPLIPYCHYHVISNEQNDGWASYTSKPNCSTVLAPSDPQSRR